MAVELSGAEIALIVVLGLNVIYFTWKLSGRVVKTNDKPYPKRIQIPGKLPSTTLSKLAELSHGSTHYFYKGVENEGNLIVCVHGDRGNYADFLYVAEILGQRDRVLCFDLFGNGYSSCDGYARTKKLFACQIAELLFKLGEFEAVHLIGHGWGATVASYFAVLFPEKVWSLSLLSPGLYGSDDKLGFGLEEYEFDHPLLTSNNMAKKKVKAKEKKSLIGSSGILSCVCCHRKSTAKSPSNLSVNDNENENKNGLNPFERFFPWLNSNSARAIEYQQRMTRCERPEPALRSGRKIPAIVYEPIKPELKILANSGHIRTLVIWGTKGSSRFVNKIKALIPESKVVHVEGYAETFHIENPEITAEQINSFIEDCLLTDLDNISQEGQISDGDVELGHQQEAAIDHPHSLKLSSPARKQRFTLFKKKPKQQESHDNEITVEIPDSPAVFQLLTLPKRQRKGHAISASSSKQSRKVWGREIDHIAVQITNVPLTEESE